MIFLVENYWSCGKEKVWIAHMSCSIRSLQQAFTLLHMTKMAITSAIIEKDPLLVK